MRWKLKDYLEQHKITAHQLALESKLSLNSVYPAVRGQAERVSLATLDRMLTALDRLTGARTELDDLLERETEESADLAEMGLEDYAAALAEIDSDVPPEELAAWNAAFEQTSRPKQ